MCGRCKIRANVDPLLSSIIETRSSRGGAINVDFTPYLHREELSLVAKKNIARAQGAISPAGAGFAIFK